jgi:hypothetical protein
LHRRLPHCDVLKTTDVGLEGTRNQRIRCSHFGLPAAPPGPSLTRRGGDELMAVSPDERQRSR